MKEEITKAIVTAINRVTTKLTSGQFILTVIAGLVFAYSVRAGLIEAQAATAIIGSVFALYFQRDREKETKQ